MAQLPEKYETLAEIFQDLHKTLWLLRLKRQNPSPIRIESLINRGFTLRHLAQLKYILSDAIEINKKNELDKRTSCVKPVLHVSINGDVVKRHGHTNLMCLLRSRLVNFSRSNTTSDEIPEVSLPVPFSCKELDVHFYLVTPTSLSPTSAGALTSPQAESETCIRDDEIAEGTEQGLNSNINSSLNKSFTLRLPSGAHREEQQVPHGEEQLVPHGEEQLQPASHLSSSFQRQFSLKVISHESISKHKRQKHK